MNRQEILVGFIGGGNMAQAILRGLLNAGHHADAILVADPDPQQHSILAALNQDLAVTADNNMVANRARILILAVKPQGLPEVARALADSGLADDATVLSVAAGVTLDSLHSWLGASTQIVRMMPNQPAFVGAGVSGLSARTTTGESSRALAGYVAESVGDAVWLQDERLMDAITAVSGSGPAYFYLLMEMLAKSAEEFGFDAGTARRIAVQTAYGAGKLALEETLAPAELRERVTSAGGTTAAALESLENDGIRDIFRKALIAARDRAEQLGRS